MTSLSTAVTFSPDLRGLAEAVLRALSERQWKLTTAESCTGGLIAGCITAMPGSSSVFDAGFVTYANEIKEALVGVRSETLSAHGAVSRETALEMAAGALRQAKADVSVAVTGIAGPDGGTPEKPVGLVHLAVQTRDGRTLHRAPVFKGDRDAVRAQTVAVALEMVLEALEG